MRQIIKTIILLIFIFPAIILSQPNYPKDPEQAQLVTADIKNFLEAYEQFSPEKDNAAILQKYYFGKASPGLQEYISRFRLNPEMLEKAIEKNPERFNRIKTFYTQISVFENEFKDEMKRYKRAVPGAMFAPTYLLVGAARGIGQASKVGQLVTIENALDDLEKLKTLMVHELTHFQQAIGVGINKYGSIYGKKDNMLDLVLREGAAEFITYHRVRENVPAFVKLRNYQQNEYQLWERFKEDLNKQDQDFWLNVSFEDNNKGYPFQLGYAVGYKIVEAYYERAENKDQALKDILTIEDAQTFFEKSKYQPKLSKLQRELLFGRPNPKAPAEIKEYEELIGDSDCTSRRRNNDGTWAEPTQFVWTYKYILDGMAVQDLTNKPDGSHTSSVREYSREDKKWYVHYFNSGTTASSSIPTWNGNRKGDEIILYRDQKAPNGTEGLYKIRFHNISDQGFEWLGAWISKDETIVFENWKISCRKRN
jgi:hypothetical protein